MDEGHCGLPTDQLIPLAEELLEAPKELILTALELERSEGAVIADKVGDTACIFLAGLYRAEQAIADRLNRIVNGRMPVASSSSSPSRSRTPGRTWPRRARRHARHVPEWQAGAMAAWASSQGCQSRRTGR